LYSCRGKKRETLGEGEKGGSYFKKGRDSLPLFKKGKTERPFSEKVDFSFYSWGRERGRRVYNRSCSGGRRKAFPAGEGGRKTLGKAVASRPYHGEGKKKGDFFAAQKEGKKEEEKVFLGKREWRKALHLELVEGKRGGGRANSGGKMQRQARAKAGEIYYLFPWEGEKGTASTRGKSQEKGEKKRNHS